MKKRILSIVLATALVASMLTACGNKAETQAPAAEAPAAEEAAAEEASD